MGRLAGLVAFGTFGWVIQRTLKLFRKKGYFWAMQKWAGCNLEFFSEFISIQYYSLGQLAGVVAFGTFGWLI